MRVLTTTVAAIALVASAVQVQAQGNGGGNGRGGGGGGKPEAGQQDRGNGGGKAERGNAGGKAERGNRGQDAGPSMAQSARGPEQRGNGKSDRGNAERGNGQGGDRAASRAERAEQGNKGRGNNDERIVDRRRGEDRDVIVDRRGDRDVVRVNDFDSIRQRGFVDGCPPGLAKKNPPCVPPGQVSRDDDWDDGEWDDRFNRPDFWGLSGLGSGRYLYDDGYLMRLGDNGRIGGYIPLLGGALGIGNPWPSFYEPVRLPSYYENFYGLGDYNSYRYADDVLYRVDPETSAITSIAALLTGDQFNIGQPLPLGYDVYNVPYQYRDQYADGPDANYRYSDGYVYQVDPTTQLIAAAIELLI